MVQVRMLCSIVSSDASAAPGDLWECSQPEADRMVAAGLAEVVVASKRVSKRTVRGAVMPPVETAATDG